ncbi:hypothetical protein D3C80_1379580 [compost metagenome]
MALQHSAAAAVFQQPQRVARVVQVHGEGTVIRPGQAQQPIAAVLFGGLAQQQVKGAVVCRVGEEVGAPLVQPQQLANQWAVWAAGQAVGADLPAAVQPGQVSQGGQACAQGVEQAGQGGGRRCIDVGLHHIHRLLGFERHVQAEVVGKLRSGLQALLAQVGLGMAELGEQLPQQQAQQNQGQQGQRTLDRPAQGSGGGQ